MKPSKKNRVFIKFNKFFPFGKYLAMMWKGNILIREKNKDKWYKMENTKSGEKLINHENIHLKQAISTKDSWFVYYTLYIWQYLCNLPLIFGFDFPYKFISFELEAYSREDDYDYLSNYKTEWKKYNKMTLSEKRKYYKQYKAWRKNKIQPFGVFINNYIKPKLINNAID